ncbi:MAG: hypothetical protein ACE5HT_04725 [Gemmatimonadales bacterium]
MPHIAHTVLPEDMVARVRTAFPSAQLTEVQLSNVLDIVATTSFAALFVDRRSLELGGWAAMARLKARFPSTVVVAYLQDTHDVTRLAFELGRIQIDEICVAGGEDHPDPASGWDSHSATAQAPLSSMPATIPFTLRPVKSHRAEACGSSPSGSAT